MEPRAVGLHGGFFRESDPRRRAVLIVADEILAVGANTPPHVLATLCVGLVLVGLVLVGLIWSNTHELSGRRGCRGFQPIFVNQDEAREIDVKLETAEFRVPYPASWGRLSFFATVPGRRLDEVLRSKIPLDQAITNAPGCTANAEVTVADVVAQKLDFPAPSE